MQISSTPPLRPCRARAKISTPTSPARPHSTELAPNNAPLIRNTRRRPNRSASAPAAISTVVLAMV